MCLGSLLYKRGFTYLVDDGDIIFCCLSDIIKEMTLKTQTKQSRLENFKRHRIVRNFQQNYKQTSPPYFSDKVLATGEVLKDLSSTRKEILNTIAVVGGGKGA